MKKNNDSLLATILGGAIFCFVFLGMAFIFTNNTKTMKGNTNSSNQQIINNDEISLGDAGTCGKGSAYSTNPACASINCSSYTAQNTCDNMQGCCSWTASTTVSCGAGQGADSSATTGCSNCAAGYYSPAGSNTCSPCTGEKSYSGVGAASCSTCEEGKIANSGHTGCVNASTTCGGGQVPSSDGTTCVNCPAGTYSPAGSNTCSNCNGTMQYSHAGAASCSTCLTGTKPNSNHTDCVNDPTVTVYCGAGQGADSSATTGCSNCAAGYYSLANDNTCHQCTGEKSYSGVGAASCSTCGEGKIANSNHTGCIDDPSVLPSCASIATLGECTARDDCEWDYTNYCHDKPSVTLVSLDGNDGGAYVTPEVNKKYIIHAVGSDGKNMSNVTWTVTPSNANALASHNCVAGNCEVVVKGWACACPAPKATITVTAKEKGSTRTASTTINVTSYGEWREGTWNKPMPSGGTVYTTTALDSAVCRAYGGYQPATGNYAKYYDRCCCGGPSNNPACYIKDDGSYTWTAYPEASWLKVEGISKEEDCKEEETEACYLDPTGEYKWGKYAKETGYTLIESIKDPVLCKKPTSEEACYRKGDDYLWTSTPPEGYTVVEGVTKPEDCGPEEKPACYLRETDGELFWGNYAKVKGYIYLEDIDTEEECKRPESDACYVDKDGNYVWGMYENDPNYTLVPSITEMSQCKADVPVPPTGISVSKLVYIFMAILMACGVGFIYYSSVVKKNS